MLLPHILALPNIPQTPLAPVPSYTDRETALLNNLTFVTDDGKVIMKGDDTTTLASGVYRNRFVQDVLSYLHGSSHPVRDQRAYI